MASSCHGHGRKAKRCSDPGHGGRRARGGGPGDYGSVSEVVRDTLRDWRLRRKVETLDTEELRNLVRQGIDSGPGLDADAVFACSRARFGQPPAT
jgi:antitoxin ParD1/3/4